MLQAIRRWYRSRSGQPWVRPWGLATPILVLVVCLPLLRPLRHPTDLSPNERARLATIESIVEHQTLAINHSSFYPNEQEMRIRWRGKGAPEVFSEQPPAMAALLAAPYWIMHRFGLTFASNAALAAYLLTIAGVTFPVAVAGGLVYRLGRIFELPRPWRFALAASAVFGSGLVAYATALNSHAPAAALVLACCGCLFHAGTTAKRGVAMAWLAMAGFCVALAGVVDMAALVFLLLLVLVILAMPWARRMRTRGVIFYALGALPPLVFHVALTMPMTGDPRPGFLHRELLVGGTGGRSAPVVAKGIEADEDEPLGPAELVAMHLADGLLGPRGLLSHFPIVLLGVGGIGAVIRHHWPAPTKTLALATFAGAIAIVLVYVTLCPNWAEPMYSVRWFIVFMPLVVFWAGAWLRNSHSAGLWAGAAALLAFSILTSLLGALSPFPPARPGEYTAYAAARLLVQGYPSEPTGALQVIAKGQ